MRADKGCMDLNIGTLLIIVGVVLAGLVAFLSRAVPHLAAVAIAVVLIGVGVLIGAARLVTG
jgi:hypothetical protein